MRKSILSVSIAAALLAPAVAPAQSPSPSPLTGNMGFFSEYVFRGLTRTNGKPALQGGFDYRHSSGAYMGTWASNISWLHDSVTGYTSSSLEWDFYGGYKGLIAGDLGYDVGLLYYSYPGTRGVATNANTLEGYGALTWKWLSGKVSYSLLNSTFGVANTGGSTYVDLTANYPVTDKISVVAHYGITSYDGFAPGSYKDYKLGAAYMLPQSMVVGAAWTNTRMNASQKGFYTNAGGRFLGDSTITLFLQKTF